MMTISSSFAEVFGGKENQDSEARATSAAAAAVAVASIPSGRDPCLLPSTPRGSKRDAPLFAAARTHRGKLESGDGTESPFGPPTARIKALHGGDIDVGARLPFGGVASTSAAVDRKPGALENHSSFSPPPISPSIGQSTWGAWDSGGDSNSALFETPWSGAKRRVTLSADKAKGVPARTHKMLFVPSNVMDSRATAFTTPTPARPRFAHRRWCVGKTVAVTAAARAEGADKRSAMAAATVAVRREVATARTTSSSGTGRKLELPRERERRRLVLVDEFDDEMAASRVGVEDGSFTTAASGGSESPLLSIPERRSQAGAGAKVALTLALAPPEECDEDISREFEEDARRNSIIQDNNASTSGRGASVGCGYPWTRLPSPSEAQLDMSFEGVENDDDVLMSPSASVVSVSSAEEDEASMRERGPGDSVTSSINSSWSMVSVDKTDREPNAREDRLSGADPVARTLLTQSDDFTVSGNGDGAHVPPHALYRRGYQHIAPISSPRAARASILGFERENMSFEVATAAAGRNLAVVAEEGCRDSRETGHASVNMFSFAREGSAGHTSTVLRATPGVEGIFPRGTRFGKAFGGVFTSLDARSLATATVGVEVTRDRHFRPIV